MTSDRGGGSPIPTSLVLGLPVVSVQSVMPIFVQYYFWRLFSQATNKTLIVDDQSFSTEGRGTHP